jgi:hypothetical protein
VRSFVELSLDTPLSALPQFVQEATRKLFAAFDGTKIPQATIEDATRRFFEKRRPSAPARWLWSFSGLRLPG